MHSRGDNPLPFPAGSAVADAPRTGLALLGPMFSLPSTRSPRSLSIAALQPLLPQSVHTARAAPSQEQNPGLALVEFHMVGDCPSLHDL